MSRLLALKILLWENCKKWFICQFAAHMEGLNVSSPALGPLFVPRGEQQSPLKDKLPKQISGGQSSATSSSKFLAPTPLHTNLMVSFDFSATTAKQHRFSYHKNFCFNTVTDVEVVASRLRNEAKCSSVVFLDIYWDCLALLLTKRNLWLRTRDGKWQLAYTDAPNSIPLPVMYIDDADQIITFIRNAITTVNWIEDKDGDSERTLENTFARRLAALPTLRTTFSRKNTTSTVARIDTFKTQGGFWTVGSISAPSAVVTEEWLGTLDIKENITLHSLGKLFIALREANDDDIMAILASSINQDATSHSSAFPGLEHADYPYSCFDSAREFAIQALVPLDIAFDHVAELGELH